MDKNFETYLHQARREFCVVAHRYDVREHKELRTAIDSMLIAYDQALLALRKQSVLEGEPLATEAEAELLRVDCANGRHFWSKNKTGTQACLFCPATRITEKL
jgi:hypothetical protein